MDAESLPATERAFGAALPSPVKPAWAPFGTLLGVGALAVTVGIVTFRIHSHIGRLPLGLLFIGVGVIALAGVVALWMFGGAETSGIREPEARTERGEPASWDEGSTGGSGRAIAPEGVESEAIPRTRAPPSSGAVRPSGLGANGPEALPAGGGLPPPPVGGTIGAPPTGPTPRPPADLLDAIDDLEREADRIQIAPQAAQRPSTAVLGPSKSAQASVLCASCGRSVGVQRDWRKCVNCGRPLCGDCLLKSVRSHGVSWCDSCAAAEA